MRSSLIIITQVPYAKCTAVYVLLFINVAKCTAVYVEEPILPYDRRSVDVEVISWRLTCFTLTLKCDHSIPLATDPLNLKITNPATLNVEATVSTRKIL